MSPSPGSAIPSRLPPEPWSEPEIVEDVIVADDVTIHRAGISTVAPDGQEVCGSAADTSGAALARARFELLERVCTHEVVRGPRSVCSIRDENGELIGSVDARTVFPVSDCPDRWQYSRSNGIALHTTWERACRRALWELAERDRILRSWHGEIVPEPIVPAAGVLPDTRSYDWRACAFPEPHEESFSRGVEVVGVFGFPTQPDRPFLLGLGARPERQEALAAAVAESLQMLAFLWGEATPSTEPAFQPTPMFHLDTFQVPGRWEQVRRWLDGAHSSYRPLGLRAARSPRVSFADLTPSWLGDGFRVAKAVCDDAVPLVFGQSPFVGHLPSELHVHPIP